MKPALFWQDYDVGTLTRIQLFAKKGHLNASDDEMMQLRKELAMIREERDILKKALGIFSSQRK